MVPSLADVPAAAATAAREADVVAVEVGWAVGVEEEATEVVLGSVVAGSGSLRDSVLADFAASTIMRFMETDWAAHESDRRRQTRSVKCKDTRRHGGAGLACRLEVWVARADAQQTTWICAGCSMVGLPKDFLLHW